MSALVSATASAPAHDVRWRRKKGRVFQAFFAAATWLGVVLLALLLMEVLRKGLPWLDPQFLTSFPSRFPERAGIQAALWGTIWLIGLTALFSIPVGVGAAVYLCSTVPRADGCTSSPMRSPKAWIRNSFRLPSGPASTSTNCWGARGR